VKTVSGKVVRHSLA